MYLRPQMRLGDTLKKYISQICLILSLTKCYFSGYFLRHVRFVLRYLVSNSFSSQESNKRLEMLWHTNFSFQLPYKFVWYEFVFNARASSTFELPIQNILYMTNKLWVIMCESIHNMSHIIWLILWFLFCWKI